MVSGAAVMFAVAVGSVSVYFDAWVPFSTTPVAVTVLPLATVLSAKLPTAAPELNPTESDPTTPVNVAEPNDTVADVPRS